MRPLFAPKYLNVVPFGLLHGDEATSGTVLTANGFRFEISGTTTSTNLVPAPPFAVLQSIYTEEFGDRFVPGSELVISFPVPLRLNGIKFKLGIYGIGGGGGGSDNVDDAPVGSAGFPNMAIRIQGLDKNASAEGIWRDLAGTYIAQLDGQSITHTVPFTGDFYAEALRMRSGDVPGMTYPGFSIRKLRSLY